MNHKANNACYNRMARATGLKASCFSRYTSFWPFAFTIIQMQLQQNLDLNHTLHLDLYIHNPFLYLLQNHIKQIPLCHAHKCCVHCLLFGCLFIFGGVFCKGKLCHPMLGHVETFFGCIRLPCNAQRQGSVFDPPYMTPSNS